MCKQRSSRQIFLPKIIGEKSLQILRTAVTAQLIFKFKLYFYSTFLFVMAEMRLEMRFNAKVVQLVRTQNANLFRGD